MKDQWSEFRLNTEWWMFCIVSLSLIKSTKLLTRAALEFVYSQQCFGFLMMCATELFLVATWSWGPVFKAQPACPVQENLYHFA